ncbi:aminotransferase class I/II-fold pyridoxal phosphate-dependent enzyme [Aquimarina agarilytica]|uniref:aminotransferase class I/II-fold pyridoxal phosphate-dependent enzyme n=1 Tax=Aquimarina agarilytica TaxID=1087449 RepID=UPI00028A28E6|nr:aminotransferase class I/II-fold pyridoxal phosphate-dependent enzyme [Aquimarina agarilytica]
MKKLPQNLQLKLETREKSSALRVLPKESDRIDFQSNDYLGFAQNPKIQRLARKLVKEHTAVKNGATGSRLLSGNHNLYPVVEEQIAAFHQTPKALLYNSGYNANIGFFSCIPQRGDVVFYDELIHASIRDGLLMNYAKNYSFKHNNLEDLQEKIARVQQEKVRNIFVVTESVFSMDGDSPDLVAFADFCTQTNSYLIVDEAHALGVFGIRGRGLVDELGIQDQVFAQIVTFGKALGCHGAAILCSEDVYDYLVNFSRSLIYTTGLPPEAIATIGAAYYTLENPKKDTARKDLLKNILHFNAEKKRLSLDQFSTKSNSAIHCCIVPGNEKVKSVAVILKSYGYEVKPILSPTVPEGKERLRFCLHSTNTFQEITEALEVVINCI